MQQGRKTRAMGVVLTWLLGNLVLGAVARGAAPPMPRPPLDAQQEKRLAQLANGMNRAAESGQFSEGLRLGRQIHVLRQSWQGARHWQTVNARLVAERWQQRARLPENQRKQLDLASARASAGVAHSARGRPLDAEKAHREALAIQLEVLGKEHPDTAVSYQCVALCLDAQGRHKDALPLYRKALAILRQVMGEEHLITASSYNNVACCLHAQGKHREAIGLWQAALLGADSGRLASGRSGFDRSLFKARFLTPRSGLAVTHALLKEPHKAWRYAEADLARGLLDDLTHANSIDRDLEAQLAQRNERLLYLHGMGKLSEEQSRLRDELTRQRRDLLVQLGKRRADRANANVWPLERIQKQPLPRAEALAEAKQWLRTLPRAEALRRAEAIGKGVKRAPGAKELPRVKMPDGPKDEPPYAHPFHWAAFVLVGDPD